MAAATLSYEDLGLVQGDGWLFRHLDVHIRPRDRLALIGRNGAGKTTLLKCLAGLIETDEGRRTVVPGSRVVLLEQDPDMSGHASLLDWVLAEPDAPAEHEAAAIADQIGLDLSRPVSTASGGERRRAAIARALAQDPDVLFLDEPTNHLDLGGIEWLEDWLNRFTGAFIVISHDRTFLTRLTKSCLWLDRGHLRRAEIGFGGFEVWMEKAYEEEARAAEKLDAKLAIELRWLERGVTARRRRNQGRLAKLHDMRAQRAAMIGGPGTAKLAIAKDEVRSKAVIDAEHVSKNYGDRQIIRDFTLRIQRGDRIGIVGPNGAGKTTLLKLLTGELAPDQGQIERAKTLSGIVIDQQRKLMEPTKRVRDVLAEGGDWIDVRGTKKHIKGYLKEFLFSPELTEAPVGSLSGGERSRLLLAREFAREANLLVLDEPTNDLDLETLDLLQEVIADYEGTVLIVSHDRDFLDRTVTVTLGLDGSGRVDIVAGGYEDWAKRRRQAAPAAKPKAAAPVEERKAATSAKLSYKDQRDLDRLPGEIEHLEAEIAAVEDVLADADLYTRDTKRFAELSERAARLRDKKHAAEERWLEVAEMADALAR
ncbi:ATP-binding cassette domain-containing protein [Sphingomonas sp. SM33]|uniref:ATP-binding cassette domain-containing protein n=1 Tax=Sphingomonas telluris TaxID=2907998 RepID=A0ABS9VHW2_9SPHN|nr:ATP-binding cassette domain-containing protein [Sphingomonas telluris]MCH8614540.1 ATP-binding cassette domain-containing protein [Sphingomonas telluris]